jgi:O-antigen ligase
LLRLVWLYGILCGLLLAAGLLYRADQEAGRWWLPGAVRSTDLPFAGINVDTATGAATQGQAALASLRAAGFEWVRLRLDWAALEPHPGVYDWSASDAWIENSVAAGLVPVVVLDGSPAWARSAQDRAPANSLLAPPAEPADMARFAAAFAQRYADDLRYYQVWDEPNIAPHWGNRWIEPVAYAQLLKAVAAAIRAADSDAVIATAALAPTTDRGHMAVDEVYFLQRMVAAGAAGVFDAVAIQPFGFGHAPGYPRQSVSVLDYRRAALIRRELSSMGLGDKALWAVRFGWNRDPNGVWGAVTPQAQASYAAEALDQAWQRWPWLEAMGWVVDRPAAAPGDPRWGFALVEPDGSDAPVFTALRQWLAAAQPSERRVSHPALAAPWCVPLPLPLPLSPCLPCWPWLAWLLLGGALLVVAWRSVAASRLLPWGRWLAGWRDLPPFAKAVGWAGLLLVYYFAEWPPLIGLCWLVWALLCLAQPRVGLVLAAGLLPFFFQHKEMQLVDAILIVPPATAAVACLVPAVVLRARHRRGWFKPVDAAALAFLAISLLSTAGAWQWSAYRQGLLAVVLIPLALWVAVRILDDEPFCGVLPGGRPVDFTYVVSLGLFAGGVLAAAWGLAAWLGGVAIDVDGVRRLVGPHFSPNHTALYLLRTLFLGIGLVAAFYAHNGTRVAQFIGVLLAAASLFVLLALVLTGSRGALLLGLPAGSLVVAWAALRRRPELLRWLAAHPVTRWTLLGGLLLTAAGSLLLWDRLLNQQTLNLRVDLWEASLRLWRDHLLLGVGPGGFFWGYPAYLLPGASVEPNQLHPHNIWLEVATTWGLLGFAWLGLLLWHVAGVAQRRWARPTPADWLSVGLVAALLAAVAHAQVDAFLLLPDLAGWNALALALLVSRCERTYSAG